MPNEKMMQLIEQQQYESMRQKLLARNKAYAKPDWQKQLAKLTPEQEQAFLKWVQTNKVPFNPKDKFPDYDMRGYYLSTLNNAGPKAGINPTTGTLHFPDTYKTPYHESFSAESQMAAEGAPSWKGSKLVTPKGEVVFEDKPEK